MNRTTQLTKEGYERLERSLQVERARLDEARRMVAAQLEANEQESLGLDEAQREVMAIEERILALEDTLAGATIIQVAPGDRATLGAVVTLVERTTGREMSVRLVSPAESSVVANGVPMISTDSPVGSRLMGRAVGEAFTVNLGKRDVTYEVKTIGA